MATTMMRISEELRQILAKNKVKGESDARCLERLMRPSKSSFEFEEHAPKWAVTLKAEIIKETKIAIESAFAGKANL